MRHINSVLPRCGRCAAMLAVVNLMISSPTWAWFTLMDSAENHPSAVTPKNNVSTAVAVKNSSPIVKPILSTSHEIWTANAGSTLKDSVSAWAKKAGWEVRWVAEELDYPIIGTLSYPGSFEDAITGIFNAHQKSERPLLVDGNAQQKLLVIAEDKP